MSIFLKYFKSFVRDDLDMLPHLPKTMNETTVLLSFFAIKLYTNVPHDYRVAAIKVCLAKYTDVFPDHIESI